MSAAVSRFKVSNLHGLRTIDVPVVDNRLVLVGENGTSKSTLADLMFYVLTRQWDRLRRYRFTSIEISISDHIFVITPEILEAHHDYRQKFIATMRHYPPTWRDVMLQWEGDVEFEQLLLDPMAIRSFTEQGLPASIVRDLVRRTVAESGSSQPPELVAFSKQISELITAQVLYLPTYRRIEQALESIFPGTEFSGEIKKVRNRIARRGRSRYTELVAFGMEDVEKAIKERLAQIKDSVRKELSNLTGTYLRDVLRGAHNKVDLQNLSALDAATLDAIFARMDEAKLPQADQTRLREKISDMAQRSSIHTDDK